MNKSEVAKIRVEPQFRTGCLRQTTNSTHYPFWDSLIVEAALAAGCKTLLSEDMQDGLRIDQVLTVQNPFIK